MFFENMRGPVSHGVYANFPWTCEIQNYLVFLSEESILLRLEIAIFSDGLNEGQFCNFRKACKHINSSLPFAVNTVKVLIIDLKFSFFFSKLSLKWFMLFEIRHHQLLPSKFPTLSWLRVTTKVVLPKCPLLCPYSTTSFSLTHKLTHLALYNPIRQLNPPFSPESTPPSFPLTHEINSA